MQAPKSSPSACVALGLLGLAVISAALVLVRGYLHDSQVATAPKPVRLFDCHTPVQLERAGFGPVLGCACCFFGVESDGPLCLGQDLCRHDSGVMLAGWRIVLGLPLELNRATAQELQMLDGIGPKLAERIVHHRQAHGPFASVEGLTAVRGIGRATMARLAPWLSAGE